MTEKDYLQLVKQVFVNNGEYNFDNERDGELFAAKLLRNIEDLYQEEQFYNKYPVFSDFIRTHHADSAAFWLYEDGDLQA